VAAAAARLAVEIDGRVSIVAGDRTEGTLIRESRWIGAPDTDLELVDMVGGDQAVERSLSAPDSLGICTVRPPHANRTWACGAHTLVRSGPDLARRRFSLRPGRWRAPT
jgi:hypothetical protein